MGASKYIPSKIIEVEKNNIKNNCNNTINMIKKHPECGMKISYVILKMLLADNNFYYNNSIVLDYDKHWGNGENIPVCLDYLNKG